MQTEETSTKKRSRKALAVVIVLIVVVVAIIGALILWPPAATTTYGNEVGDSPYDFTLPDTNNVMWNLQLHIQNGKPILLEFIHPGVPVCVAVATELGSLNAAYGGSIEIVSIAVTFEYGTLENPPTINTTREMKNGLGSTWTYLVEVQGTEVRDLYGIDALPTFFLIGKAGKIAYTQVGAMNMQALRDAIDQELAR